MSVSQCLFCKHDNPQGSKFCNECGSPLHLKLCSECEAINEAASKYCYKCGAAFSAVPDATAGEAPTAIEAVTQVPDEAVTSIAPPFVDESPPAPRSRLRRGLAVALTPLAFLGATAIGGYYAYRNPVQVREWLGAAKPASQNRDVASVGFEGPNDVASAPISGTSVTNPAVTASSSGAQDNKPGTASHIGPEDATPAQIATGPGTALPTSDMAAANADKNSTSSPKARAKKSKKTTARKQDQARK